MNLLVAIHPVTMGSFWKQTKELVARSFREDPNTFFVMFPQSHQDPVSLMELAVDFPGKEDRFILVEKKENDSITRFKGYGKSFGQALEIVGTRLGPKEKMRVVSFGGSAGVCYKRINPAAHKLIAKRFGGRVIGQHTFMPLMYGIPEAEKRLAESHFGELFRAAQERAKSRRKK